MNINNMVDVLIIPMDDGGIEFEIILDRTLNLDVPEYRLQVNERIVQILLDYLQGDRGREI